jgi:type II secretory pathway pseudopilin PulG
MLRQALRARAGQRGMSLVELMVGITVGMFVVAAAATLVSSQLVDNRRLMLELQVQQDLRATADIITRDLRRIGADGYTGTNVTSPVWTVDATPISKADVTFNSILGFSPGTYDAQGTANTSEGDSIEFNSPRKFGQVGPYGYKLVTDESAGTGVIKTRIPDYQDQPGGGWTDLSDVDAVKIVNFNLKWIEEEPIVLACPRLCPATNDKSCWPTIKVRAIEITIRGASRSDPSVVREVRSVARLRNDFVDFKVDPSNPDSPSCPE